TRVDWVTVVSELHIGELVSRGGIRGLSSTAPLRKLFYENLTNSPSICRVAVESCAQLIRSRPCIQNSSRGACSGTQHACTGGRLLHRPDLPRSARSRGNRSNARRMITEKLE